MPIASRPPGQFFARSTRVFFTLACLSLALSLAARAGTVHGTVKNGTTGKPASGISVMLIQLQGGMQPVGNTQSNAQGEFSFDNANLGVQPMLIRAVYHGINFHQPVPPGNTAPVDVSVFEPSTDAKAVRVDTRVVFFQPNGPNVIVGEEYSVVNGSQPPEAYFRPDGNFEFSVPQGAKLQQIAASGPAGMPVVQAPIDKTKGRYAIAYAFRPGESVVRYSYELPYPNNAASVKIPPSPWAARRLLVVAPPTLQVTGDGLQSGGQEQGMSIYGRENLAANATISVSISGTAPPPAPDSADPTQQQGRGQEPPATSAAANIQTVPGRLDVLKWPLVAGFIGVFAVGAIFLARKPVAVTVPAVPTIGESSSAPSVTRAPESFSGTAVAASSTSGTPLETVNAAVSSSLEYLKEQLFRLELRHQAGTIGEEEYATERARAEKVLRDLVRG